MDVFRGRCGFRLICFNLKKKEERKKRRPVFYDLIFLDQAAEGEEEVRSGPSGSRRQWAEPPSAHLRNVAHPAEIAVTLTNKCVPHAKNERKKRRKRKNMYSRQRNLRPKAQGPRNAPWNALHLFAIHQGNDDEPTGRVAMRLGERKKRDRKNMLKMLKVNPHLNVVRSDPALFKFQMFYVHLRER